MAPAQSKPAKPLTTQPERTGQCKRKVSSRITDENFVGAETNVVTKCLKLSANATRNSSMAVKQHWASVENVEDDSISVNDSPKNPNVLLEATDGSDDDDDMDPAPALEATEPYSDNDNDNNNEPEIIKP